MTGACAQRGGPQTVDDDDDDAFDRPEPERILRAQERIHRTWQNGGKAQPSREGGR